MKILPQQIKVLKVMHSLVLGGTEKMAYDLISKAREPIAYTVLCLDELGVLGKKIEEQGIPVLVLNRKPGFDVKLIRQFVGILKSGNFQLIHAQQYTPFFYSALSVLVYKFFFWKTQPKLIFTEHGIHFPFKKKWKRYYLNPFLFSLAHKITTISHDTKKNLIQYDNYSDQKTLVMYNGIDLSRFSHLQVPSDLKKLLGIHTSGKVIGIVARLDPVKNHPMLFRAFRDYQKMYPDSWLLVVGEGPEEQKLKNLARELSIQSHTIFTGGRSDIPELLQVMDFFVLPSHSEGLSVTLIEAMCAGKPIITTRVGGNPEVIEENTCGYLIPDNDHQSLTEKLIFLSKNPPLSASMGKSGRERAQKLFSLEAVLDKHLKMYQELLTHD